MRYYHRTAAANAILTEGFRDGEGTYATGEMQRGVFLSDFALDANEGAGRRKDWAANPGGLPVLAVDIDEELVSAYEWINDDGISYREWCVPAELLNKKATVRLLTDDEVDEAEWGWQCYRIRILWERGEISEEEYRTQTTRTA